MSRPFPVADSEDVSVFLVEAQVARSVVKIDVLMLFVGTVLVEEDDRSRYLAGIPARGGYVKEGLVWMSGDDSARKVELHFLSNLELEAFALRGRLYDPKSIFLRARRIDVEGLAKKADVRKGEKE